jgi:hypothetical protein
MKRIVKFLLRSLAVLIVLLLLTSPLWIKKVPIENVRFLIGYIDAVDKYLCEYTIPASGQSMDPIIPIGSPITLDQCFTQEEVGVGTVVLFKEGTDIRLGIVRLILPLEPKVYKISNEINYGQLKDKILSDIVAINNEVDTSQTKYVETNSVDAYLLDPSTIFEYFYLTAVPIGVGIENAEILPTTVFDSKKDKFCTVIKPLQSASNISTDIMNLDTMEVTTLTSNSILLFKATPNIGCREFGTNLGQVDLRAGRYTVRLSKDYQVLVSIEFQVY